MLSLPACYYRSIPIDQAAEANETVTLDPRRTAFIGMHCWNIGCPDGPAIDPDYCVGMGFREALEEAGRIMRDYIRPAMDAARAAGLLVCHVENAQTVRDIPAAQQDTDPPPTAPGYSPPPVVPGWREAIVARAHGADYAAKSPYARMARAEVVAPQGDEPVVYQTNQFDRILRRHGIENLVYTGFATDMCILFAPGGINDMARFGYRIFLMREATIGVEYPDTFAERLCTRWGLRYVEFHYGHTIGYADFVRACAGG